MTSTGFPHSEISGSTPVCGSPKLIAANHVLHRLLTPRHSPCALSSLATNLMWNPGRVPHLRRSLRQAKLGSVRVGGARLSLRLHIFDAFPMGEPTISTWQCDLRGGPPTKPTPKCQTDRNPPSLKWLRITTFKYDTPSIGLRPKSTERAPKCQTVTLI